MATTNMALTLPTVSSTVGPTFATQINTALETVDLHDHTTGFGVRVPSAGLNINADVPVPGYSLYDAKSYRLRDAVSALTGADWARGLHAVGNDLYWCNGAGVAVQITSGSSIVGTSGSITNLPSGGAVYGAGTCVWKQSDVSANKAMTQDAGRVRIRDESVTDGTAKAVTVQVPAGLAADYGLSLPGALPGSGTKFLRVDSAGAITDTVDADASTLEVSGASLRIKDSGVTRAKMVGVGQAVSSSCGDYSLTSTTITAVTNLSVSLTTTGRPVVIFCEADGTSNAAYLGGGAGGTLFYVYRGATMIQTIVVGVRGVPSTIFCMDPAAAGTYTYTVKIAAVTGGETALAKNLFLVAYEL